MIKCKLIDINMITVLLQKSSSLAYNDENTHKHYLGIQTSEQYSTSFIMTAIVDVQGFKTEANKFVLKEIAILCSDKLQMFLIKPPFPFYDLTKQERRQVAWIERNRKICWGEGFIPYSNYQYLILDLLRDKCIYIKGLEKVLWLKNILNNNNVINLEDKGCPSLPSLYDQYKYSEDLYSCIYHSSICALKNVLCLKKWCSDNKLFI